MKRILIANRGDLIDKSKLKDIENIVCEDFQDYLYTRIKDYEVVIFHCDLFNKSIILKNRYTSPSSEVFEGDSMALLETIFYKTGGDWS